MKCLVCLFFFFSPQVAEPPPSTLRSGNLSFLKKRWEQQQQQLSSHRPQTQAFIPADPQSPVGQPAGPTPTHNQTSKTTSVTPDQDPEPETLLHPQTSETSTSRLLSAQREDPTNMEKPSRGSEGQDGATAAELSDCEKPSVPLNSLKMMFEKGENLTDRVSLLFLIMETSRLFSKHECSQDGVKRLGRCELGSIPPDFHAASHTVQPRFTSPSLISKHTASADSNSPSGSLRDRSFVHPEAAVCLFVGHKKKSFNTQSCVAKGVLKQSSYI